MAKSRGGTARDAARHTKGFVSARATRSTRAANRRRRGDASGGFNLSAAEPARSRKQRRGRR